jgi:hypothetical protein
MMMDYELERMWKVVAWFKVLSRNLAEENEKNRKSSARRVGVLAQFRTGNLPHGSQKHYSFNQLALSHPTFSQDNPVYFIKDIGHKI